MKEKAKSKTKASGEKYTLERMALGVLRWRATYDLLNVSRTARVMREKHGVRICRSFFVYFTAGGILYTYKMNSNPDAFRKKILVREKYK